MGENVSIHEPLKDSLPSNYYTLVCIQVTDLWAHGILFDDGFLCHTSPSLMMKCDPSWAVWISKEWTEGDNLAEEAAVLVVLA